MTSSTASNTPCTPATAPSPLIRSSSSVSPRPASPRDTPWTTWTATSTAWPCHSCRPDPPGLPRPGPRRLGTCLMRTARPSGGQVCCGACSAVTGERAERLRGPRRRRRYSGTDTPRKEPLVSTSFERVSRVSVGYDQREVDEFLSRARTAYEGRDPAFTGADITSASFGTERGGYDMRVVDEALDRLSDAFALQARDDAIAEHGEEAWIAQLTERADLLKERLERPAGDRFAPAAQGEPAYDRADVDALCDQLVAYFTEGLPMSVDDVRRAAFRRRRGSEGYREAVVDVYLDHVADVMASVP